MSADTLSAIKKLAHKAGTFGNVVTVFDKLWREDAAAFETVLAQSWSCSEFVPMVPTVLMTKNDDPKLREAVRRVVATKRVDRHQKASLFIAPALWGDDWAKQYLIDDLAHRLQQALESRSPKLLDLAWSLQRAAMIGHWGHRGNLEQLRRRFEKKELYDDECRGMVDAFLETGESGFPAVAHTLEVSSSKRKVSAVDVARCFVLGTARDREHTPLFLRVHRELPGYNFWRKGLRRRALSSFTYAMLPAEAVQQVIEEWLVRERRKLASWWFGADRTSEFMNACDILWNVETPLSPGIVTILQAVAVGSNKENAKESIALLSLKGIEVPPGARFAPGSIDVKWRQDFIQYDQLLNFAYYWRCKPPFHRVA